MRVALLNLQADVQHYRWLYTRIGVWALCAIVTTCAGFGDLFLGLWYGSGAAAIAVVAALLFHKYLDRRALVWPVIALPLLYGTARLALGEGAGGLLMGAPCVFGMLVFLELGIVGSVRYFMGQCRLHVK